MSHPDPAPVVERYILDNPLLMVKSLHLEVVEFHHYSIEIECEVESGENYELFSRY